MEARLIYRHPHNMSNRPVAPRTVSVLELDQPLSFAEENSCIEEWRAKISAAIDKSDEMEQLLRACQKELRKLPAMPRDRSPKEDIDYRDTEMEGHMTQDDIDKLNTQIDHWNKLLKRFGAE